MTIKLMAAVAACSLAMAASASAATFTTFDSRVAFSAAAGSTTTETFDSYGSDVNLVGTTEDVGPFTMDGTGLSGLSLIESDGSSAFNIDGTAFWRGIGTSGSLVFHFDTAIKAFGADLFGINNSIERTRISIGSETFLLPVVGGSVASFFGVTSDMAFTSISFDLVSGEDAGIDNVTFSPVPVPASLPLLAVGLGGLGYMARRKRKAS